LLCQLSYAPAEADYTGATPYNPFVPSIYTALAADWHLLHRPRLAAVEFLAALAGAPPGCVVDVGAASSEYAALLQRRGYEAYAVDVSRAMYEAATERHPGLRVIHGDMLEVFDLVRGPLSLAYCIGGTLCELAALNEAGDVINQMLDLARPTGCVVVEVPNFDHLRSQAQAGDDHVELQFSLPPVSGYREDGEELRLEQQYVWRADWSGLTLRWQFDAPGESCGGELQLLELTRTGLELALPKDAQVRWYGDWDGSAWFEQSAHTIGVIRPDISA
jgi:SAM-dependent methyltransferase